MAIEQLPLMEHFRSIQGEGYHTGLTSYFLRIGGCDVGCHWCDVKESWDASKHPMTEVQAVIDLPAEHDQVAVITGGEPMMWDMGNLTNGLNNRSIRTHLETSGAYP
ncbi:MAG: 4Fe-4S cluster-binding domain-containing protein, partial [Flavobacteriales bacterium]|nr:4Fe-4S cluster-binding domain-containing protein [Flavobacteriales bacterium]